MNIVASNAHFRQRVIKKSYKVGVTAASKYYRISRNAIYEWRKKYDGNRKSLMDKSHRPAHHPNEHTQAEKEMILRRYPRYKDDMIMLWGSLRKSGYTAVDECTRWTFREMYDEHSTYSSRDFLLKLIAAAPFQIREIQTDNGSEFTNANVDRPDAPLTSFELLLQKMDIIYHRIKIATPRHNGKVERQHRTDEQRFYKKMKMYNLEDGRKQLAKYNKKSNDIPKICLEFKTPNEVMAEYLGIM